MELNKKRANYDGAETIYSYYDVPVEDGVVRFPFASCRLTYHRETKSKLMPEDLER